MVRDEVGEPLEVVAYSLLPFRGIPFWTPFLAYVRHIFSKITVFQPDFSNLTYLELRPMSTNICLQYFNDYIISIFYSLFAMIYFCQSTKVISIFSVHVTTIMTICVHILVDFVETF